MTDGRTRWWGVTTITAHSPDCAHYGDSYMPCTCGAEPEVIGVDAMRLRGLLSEARKYLTPATADDHGCADGECPECDMLRLGLRIDAELGAQP